MGSLKEKGAALGLMVGTLLMGALVMAGAASATPADPVEDAFGDLTTKTTLYGGLAVALVVLGIGILFGIKWAKRGANKA